MTKKELNKIINSLKEERSVENRRRMARKMGYKPTLKKVGRVGAFRIVEKGGKQYLTINATQYNQGYVISI